jgi:hypothetical protein
MDREAELLEDLYEMPAGDPRRKHMALRLKRRRRTSIVKKMLEDQGHGDLAKMIRVIEEEDNG